MKDNSEFRGLGPALRRVALAYPNRAAFVGSSQTLTYATFWRSVEVFAARLSQDGVCSGDTIGFSSKDALASMSLFFATSILGARLLQTSRPRNLEDGQPMRIYSTDPLRIKSGEATAIDHRWSPMFGKSAAKLSFDDVVAGQVDENWLILSTSGTSGTPKYFSLSQRMVFDRSMAVQDDFVCGETIFASGFPADSRPFLARGAAALLNGCTIVDSGDPIFWAKCGVTLFCASPAQARKLIAVPPTGKRIARCEIGGAPLEAHTIRALFNYFEAITDVYGASETSKSFANNWTLAAEGIPIVSGQRRDSLIEIVDDTDTLMPVGEIGTIRIQNAYMIRGYIGEPKATEDTFRLGWFYPGDLGFFGPNGELVISGRSSDLINLAGTKISPSLVEAVLQQCPSVIRAACYVDDWSGDSKRFGALVETSDQSTLPSVLEYCRHQLGEDVAPEFLLPVVSIPQTKKGAPDRVLVREIAKKLQIG